MTSRLLTAGGDTLVDASGNFLVWELEFATGSMTLAASSPSMVFAAAAPSLSFATSSPTISITTSED